MDNQDREKTSMQLLIEFLEENIGGMDGAIIIGVAKNLLEKEKAQIINSYRDGYFDDYLKDNDEYYFSKYNQKQ